MENDYLQAMADAAHDDWVRTQETDELKAELTKLRNALDVAERALSELYALVNGECPSLLNDDSGGNAQLYIDIQDALTTIKQAKEQ